jgi:hypothetical protein
MVQTWSSGSWLEQRTTTSGSRTRGIAEIGVAFGITDPFECAKGIEQAQAAPIPR